MANQSQAEQFDQLYGWLWRVLLKADTEDLSQHDRQLLHHVPAEKGIPLGVVASHLGMPKSSASEQVKSLERRGFLTRTAILRTSASFRLSSPMRGSLE